MDKETIIVKGKEVFEKVREILRKGNVTRICIKTMDDDVILNLPVNMIVVGGLIAPVLAGAAFMLALVKSCKIEMIKNSEAI